MTFLTEDDIAELLAFLVTAARTQTDEAPEYGPFRLMTAASQLAGKVSGGGSPELRQLVSRIRSFPPTLTPAADPDGYRSALDSLCTDVADYLLAAQAEQR
jgi:hypothetical protein